MTHAHKPIRSSSKHHRHTPKEENINPSSHNHHGVGAFCRYHKSVKNPAVRKYCLTKRKKR